MLTAEIMPYFSVKFVAAVKISSSRVLRVSTSAPMGDLDPYPQVYRLSKFKLRSGQVIEYR